MSQNDDPVMGDLSSRCTASGKPPTNPDSAPTPTSATRQDGQKADHWVLCETERAKGFVRPVRDGYVHVGIAGPEGPLRALTDEEQTRWKMPGAQYEEYTPDHPYKQRNPQGGAVGRFWSPDDLARVGKGCGTRTKMPMSIAETYARQPGYYGSTFCCGCGDYFPVGRGGEFVWDGTTERVGT